MSISTNNTPRRGLDPWGEDVLGIICQTTWCSELTHDHKYMMSQSTRWQSFTSLAIPTFFIRFLKQKWMCLNTSAAVSNDLDQSGTVCISLHPSTSVYNGLHQSASIYISLQRSASVCIHLHQSTTVCNDPNQFEAVCISLHPSTSVYNSLQRSRSVWSGLHQSASIYINLQQSKSIYMHISLYWSVCTSIWIWNEVGLPSSGFRLTLHYRGRSHGRLGAGLTWGWSSRGGGAHVGVGLTWGWGK